MTSCFICLLLVLCRDFANFFGGGGSSILTLVLLLHCGTSGVVVHLLCVCVCVCVCVCFKFLIYR